MGHHTQHIVPFTQYPRNATNGPIGVSELGYLSGLGAIAEGDALAPFQFRQGVSVAEVVPLHMPDGNLQYLARGKRLGKGAAGGLSAYIHLLADVAEPGISQQRPGQHTALTQDLEAVTDPQ